MKQNKILLGVILSCLMAISLAQTCCNQNIVRVGGLGETKIAPDIALIYTSIIGQGKTASEALCNIDSKLDVLYNVMKVNGVARTDITTSYFSIYPKYNYTNGTSVIVGQTASVSISISIRGIDKDSKKIAKIFDGLSSVGVSSISGVTYDTVDPNAGKSAARKLAWEDALEKAKQYVKLSGRKLGKVLAIQQTSQNYYPYYGGNANQSMLRGDQTLTTSQASPVATPDIPTGQVVVVVNVVVTWQLV